jgi:prepilin-type N-terminal cleavage/methylation domain-containing protein
MSKNKQSGFTLVELSIVIVIIGLIVAAVVAGQSLVKQAQLRSIISEQEGIKTAINSFKLQYGGLPGDITNGSAYWVKGCLATGAIATDSDASACNGDGNKQILLVAGDTGESYMAWYQLGRAGLYSGSFVPGAVLTGTLNINIPASKFSGAGITLVYDESTTLYATAGDGATSGGRNMSKNVILFGGAVSATLANGTIFSSPQVYGLDLKVDDGNPVKGTVQGVGVSGATAASDCITTATSVYNLGATDASPCAVAFSL